MTVDKVGAGWAAGAALFALASCADDPAPSDGSGGDASGQSHSTGGLPAGSAGRSSSGGAGTGGTASGSAGSASGSSTGGANSASGGSASGAASGGSASGSPSGGSGGSSTGVGGSSGSGGAAPGKVSYASAFDLTESPISELGVWVPGAAPFTPVVTANGRAFGTQAIGSRPEAEHYNDSFAYLKGYPPNQRASGVIHKATLDPNCTHEVEILLRWDFTDGKARGYECNLAWDGAYAEIVRWEGVGNTSSNFTYLSNGGNPGGNGRVPSDGDVFSAEIVDGTVRSYLNGELLTSVTDSSVDGHAKWTSGGPGLGFYRGLSGCGTLGDYGYESFSASSIDP